jgi:large subunit ribosomal protein L6e
VILQKVLGNTGPKKAAAPVAAGKYYPADDVKTPLPSRVSKKNAPKVRASIAPGTVLILLAGRFRGKRVVALKVLESGLVLVSGPYKINGVPLRRVSPTYVIATSTTVDVSSVDISAVNDTYFARADSTEEDDFFAGDAKKAAVVSDQRKADQKKVDAALLKVVEAVPMLKAYLNAKFTLTNNDKPHKMAF